MSRNLEGLPSDAATAIKYVQSRIDQGWVTEVYLIGSRSPKTRREPRDDSDWDLVFFTDRANHYTPLPRDLKILNACVDVVNMGKLQEFLKYNTGAVMLYPDRESDVLPEFEEPDEKK